LLKGDVLDAGCEGDKMKQRFLSLCGVIAPLLFIFVAILGGALRPGYNHVTDTVSELFSPGAPNKLLLGILHTLFAFLLTSFGVGVLRFIRRSKQSSPIGIIGASLYIAMGLLNVATATLFPQDAWGTPATFTGEMHKILSGVLSLLSMLSMTFIGIWFRRTKLFRGFGTYSFITVVVVILTAGFFMAKWGSPIMGLAERTPILVGFLWTFILALWLFSRSA
jgi:hypothetical membrane protein